MAKRYHQSKNDRLDESLGERRGKESGKKQSYTSRRDESRGMKGKDYGHDGKDHPSRHMGHGEFANMPTKEVFKAYPKEGYTGRDYLNDTMTGIDESMKESEAKRKRYLSEQK